MIVVLLTPPGRAASLWVGALVGIGDVGGPPTQEKRGGFMLADTAVVIDDREAPDGSRNEWVAYRCHIGAEDGVGTDFKGIGCRWNGPAPAATRAGEALQGTGKLKLGPIGRRELEPVREAFEACPATAPAPPPADDPLQDACRLVPSNTWRTTRAATCCTGSRSCHVRPATGRSRWWPRTATAAGWELSPCNARNRGLDRRRMGGSHAALQPANTAHQRGSM